MHWRLGKRVSFCFVTATGGTPGQWGGCLISTGEGHAYAKGVSA